ncbi:MAG TPA: divalent metal cation transporter [Actinomycetota bacterium]|nr:divalent metal cation transporter [Actinomycetota bacterium]
MTSPSGGSRKRRPTDHHHPGRGRLRGFGYFRRLGPGFVTGAADDDPAGIGTYSQVGAMFRFDLLWTALVSLPLASAVQETAARLGLTSGRGLMYLIKRHFARPVLWLATALVVGANVFNIGADLGSMAEAFRLLIPVPFALLVVGIAGAILLLEVFVTYDRYSLILRWLALSIFAYVLELFVVDVDWSQVAAGLIPSFQPTLASVEALVAIFGTTISPYLFVWQAGEEVEERKAGRIGKVEAKQIRAMRVDVVSGMSAGVLVMFAIMVSSATTLGAHGSQDVATAAEAARALEPIAGRFASLLFAAGIVGTGLLAIPTLAGSAAYALAETFGWREGLGRRLREAPGFYGVVTAAIAIGLGLNFVGIDPIRALYVSAILNGLAAPPLILLMLILSRSRRSLTRSGWLSDGLMIIALLVMTASAAVYLIGSLVG